MEYQVYSITYQQTEFHGSLKDCREFVKEQKQAEKDLGLPKEKLVIEKR